MGAGVSERSLESDIGLLLWVESGHYAGSLLLAGPRFLNRCFWFQFPCLDAADSLF